MTLSAEKGRKTYDTATKGIENCTVIAPNILWIYSLLSLNKCAYTNMIYGETGEKQLSLRVKYKIVKYWSRLITS